jgi:hypothetical protein
MSLRDFGYLSCILEKWIFGGELFRRCQMSTLMQSPTETLNDFGV